MQWLEREYHRRAHSALGGDPLGCSGDITARLRAVGIRANPLEDNALELLIQATDGLPRAINHLAQRALEEAASAASASISATHVQKALDRLPWLTTIAL